MIKKRKLKIAFLTSTFLPSIGGSQIGLHNISLGLFRLGHEPIVIMPYGCYSKLLKQNWKLPYRIIPLPPKIFRAYYFFPNILILVIKIYLKFINVVFNFDFWIANMAYPSGVILSRSLSKSKKNFTAVLCSGEDIQISEEINYGLRINDEINHQVKKYLPNVNHFISLTNSVEKEFLKLNINSNNIYEIPYGVNPEDLIIKTKKNVLRKKHKIENSDFVFICVGRNHPKKNFKLLNSIVNELKKYDLKMSFKILIIGKEVNLLLDNILRDENEKYFILKEEIGSLDINNIKFPSNLLAEYYNLSDCFLFPSNLETFGIVLAEAMIGNLPIITTNAPGCRDVVRGNQDGMVFDIGDFKNAAKLMKSIINDPSILENFKIKSKLRSKDFFIKSIAEKYEKIVLDNINI